MDNIEKIESIAQTEAKIRSIRIKAYYEALLQKFPLPLARDILYADLKSGLLFKDEMGISELSTTIDGVGGKIDEEGERRKPGEA